jgi:hypothetical protein
VGVKPLPERQALVVLLVGAAIIAILFVRLELAALAGQLT